MKHRPVLYVIGLLLNTMAKFMMIPVIYNLLTRNPKIWEFVAAGAITLFTGLLLTISFKPQTFHMQPRQIFVLTTLSWLAVSTFAALPFWFALPVSYTDAFFETMSGITTTGSTILAGLDQMNPGVLLWRSLLQWFGGVGFIVMAVAVLPFLKVGGMRLFQSESSDWSEKAMPRSGSIAKRIVTAYLIMTAVCAYLYFLGGMTGFEAINHSMSTVSTGGYSTSDASMGHFENPFILWTSTIFMILASLPFMLFVRSMRGEVRCLVQDTQTRAFIGFLLVVWFVLSLWLWMTSDYTLFQSLTVVSFNTTSTVTTTGYAYGDYTQWGGFASLMFFFLLFVGGCSGSTTGGIKIFRFQIGAKLLNIQLKQLVHPRGCFVQTYNGQQIGSDILRSLIGFTFFFVLLIALISLLLALCGLDPITSLSGATTAVTNVGPGLGDIIGPAGNFLSLPDGAKWILSVGMLLGRLEVITVLVLLTPAFWKE